MTKDRSGYVLGPHTDSPVKVATALFYMPVRSYLDGPHNALQSESFGTSLYLPKDPTFRCPGGAHHPRSAFDLVHTFPYAPNTMFAFFKTDNSFHGVEPVESREPRRLLIYDCRVARGAA